MKDTPVFAFPIDSDIDINRDQPWCGMTLRDYFAAKAMQCITPILYEAIDEDSIYESIASDAYLFADAMMEARNV